MCNAWNHPLGCHCGWGGERHSRAPQGNATSPAAFAQVATRRYRDLLDSFTTPNACCPVCGAQVYFYQSESGGRVFFDEFGPPWPRHPCTESTGKLANKSVPANESQNWQPLLIESFAEVPTYSHCYAVSGHSMVGHIAFFVRSSRLQLRAPFFISIRPDGDIRLSAIQPYMNGFTTITVPASRSLLEASRSSVDAWTRQQEVELQIFELMNRPTRKDES